MARTKTPPAPPAAPASTPRTPEQNGEFKRRLMVAREMCQAVMDEQDLRAGRCAGCGERGVEVTKYRGRFYCHDCTDWSTFEGPAPSRGAQ